MTRSAPVSDPRYARATFISPSPFGYIQIAAEVDHEAVPSNPQQAADLSAPSLSPKRQQLIAESKEKLKTIQNRSDVVKATIFEAIMIPPGSVEEGGQAAARRARNDLAILIETDSPESAVALQESEEFKSLLESLKEHTSFLHVMTAKNVRRISDVDKSKQGVFLFNYFLGDPSNSDRLVNTWEYTAGWFTQESDLHNSTLLKPLDGQPSSYVAINNARWDSLAPVLQGLRQPSFKDYVMANVAAEGAVAMPVYRLAVSE